MAEIGPQKGFYDDKRQFQGKDLAAANTKGGEKPEHQVFLALVVAGIVGLLMVWAFWARVMASPQQKLPDPDKIAKKYAGSVYQVDPMAAPAKPDKPAQP